MARKKQDKPIRIHSNEIFQVIPAGPPNGTILAMSLVCGNCKHAFERRYSLAQLSVGFPHETCENCSTVNYVPYTLSGRHNA